MENKLGAMKNQLVKCYNLISNCYTNPQISDIYWLNDFCAECLKVANLVQSYVTEDIDKKYFVDGNDHIETIFLCLTQILTCIKHIERTIKAEEAGVGLVISASREHFFDRIRFCIQRMRESSQRLEIADDCDLIKPLKEQTFVQHMDLLLDYLLPYSAECENSDPMNANVAVENSEAMFVSTQIRCLIELLLSHTLAFANVALQEDKKALSALCQKVMRECNAFQEECELNRPNGFIINDCNRKLKAICLENAIRQLEAFINDALLRLVFNCFLDFDRFSVEKLRHAIRTNSTKPGVDDTVVDEFIADFDVNIDRATQIGVFAIAFAHNMKMKTIVRSCLASFESLDTYLVPSLQTYTSMHAIHSEILEQHFNEEVTAFKNILQEIVDSSAFVGCYLELLTDCISKNEKKLQKNLLQEILQMGEFIQKHFQLKVNRKLLYKRDYPERRKYFEQFNQMLRECQAILSCANQVDSQQIMKRFKILRNVVRKFQKSLYDGSDKNAQTQPNDNLFIMCDEQTDDQNLFDSFGISPSIRSILYCKEMMSSRQRMTAGSDSLKVNYVKTPNNKNDDDGNLKNSSVKIAGPQVKMNVLQQTANQQQHLTGYAEESGQVLLKRKASLRTTMFKRQNMAISERLYNLYKTETSSLQINDILDEFTNLTSNLTKSSRSLEVIASI